VDNWKKDFNGYFEQRKQEKKRSKENLERRKAEVENFFKSVVAPAFDEIKIEVEKKYNREAYIHEYPALNRVSIRIYLKKEKRQEHELEEYTAEEERQEFIYFIQAYISSDATTIHSEKVLKNEAGLWLKGSTPITTSSGVIVSDISKVTKELIINNFLECYTTYRNKA